MNEAAAVVAFTNFKGRGYLRLSTHAYNTLAPRVLRPISTQEGFGRILVDLARDDDLRRHPVTTSPDVATTTNLAGWINEVGVLSENERQTWSHDPMVTVQDAASHSLSWIGGALGVPTAPLGVDAFGQSGGIADLYRDHHLDAGSIVNAALGVAGL